MMRARHCFSSKIVDRAGKSFCGAAVVDEDQRGCPLAHNRQQPRMDRAPYRGALRPLRSRAARHLLQACPSRAISSTGTSMRSSRRFGSFAFTIVTGRNRTACSSRAATVSAVSSRVKPASISWARSAEASASDSVRTRVNRQRRRLHPPENAPPLPAAAAWRKARSAGRAFP